MAAVMPRAAVSNGRSFVVSVSLILAALCCSSTAFAVNETPSKKTAIIFAPHSSALTVDERVENWLCSENYSVTKYVPRDGYQPATLDNLKAISTSGFGVLVMFGHGATDGITIEEFATAEERHAQYLAYKADPAYADIKNSLTEDSITDFGSDTKGFAIGLEAAGLNKLFGTAGADRRIIAVLACHSSELQSGNTPHPFGATEFLGLKGAVDQTQLTKGLGGFRVMGGPEGIPKRPVVPAFDGRMLHEGPGNTTLAPACTSNLPVEGAILPLKVKTDGKTIYETKMSTANPSIMTLEKDECVSTLSNQHWASVTEHDFKIEPTKPGRIVFKVDPTLAVSANNGTELIGNLHKLDEEGAIERPEVNDCPFGQSGLDGLSCIPPHHVPYRWCVWCKERPADPGIPGRPSKPERPTNTHQSHYDIAPGERDAFVIYQGSADSLTVINVFGLAPNMSFTQVGDWYGHMVFTPDASQVGTKYTVQIESHDINGPRDQGDITWHVVPRANALTAFVPDDDLAHGDLGRQIVQPGNVATYSFVVANSGNTVLQEIALAVPGFAGPATIPPSAIVVTPSTIDLLEPGDAVPVTVDVHTQPLQQVGSYLGLLAVSATASDGPVGFSAAMSLRVNRPPSIAGPTDTLHVDVGQPIVISLGMQDADLDPLVASIDRSQFGGALSASGQVLTFQWTPPEDAVGVRAFPIVASDGFEPTVHELWFQVGDLAAAPPSRPAFTFLATPNPASGLVWFTLGLDRAAEVSVAIYDLNGRRVAQPIVGERMAAGRKTWPWTSHALASGVYFVRARIGLQQIERRIIWLGGS